MLLRKRSQKVDVLRGVPLFGGLSNKHLDTIARSVDEVHIQQAHVVARQGSVGRELFIILRGKARVERDGKLIARLKEGDTFGEMSLIDGQSRSGSVIADEDLDLLIVDWQSFSPLLDSVPGLARKLLATLSERLRTADIQLAMRN